MDTKRLLQLAGVRIDEAQAEFDYSKNRPEKLTPVKVRDYDFKGRADMKDRITNKQGDNPMVDADKVNSPSLGEGAFDEPYSGPTSMPGRADMPNRIVNQQGDNPMAEDGEMGDQDFTNDDLDRLHRLLNAAQVSDADIMQGGLRFTDLGYQRIARKFGYQGEPETFVDGMVVALGNKLGAGDPSHREPNLDEATGERFSYHIGFMGGVGITDAESGQETYVDGGMATELRNQIEQQSNPAVIQQVLARYARQSRGEPLESQGEQVTGGGMNEVEYETSLELPDPTSGGYNDVPVVCYGELDAGSPGARGEFGRPMEPDEAARIVIHKVVRRDTGEEVSLSDAELERLGERALEQHQQENW